MEDQFEIERHNMVKKQIAERGLHDPRLLTWIIIRWAG